MKKGISPLVATILVIGFTIVLAALVMQWGSQLFGTTISYGGCRLGDNMECMIEKTDSSYKESCICIDEGRTIMITSESNIKIKTESFRYSKEI